MSTEKAVHPAPNRSSSISDREQQARAIRAWLDEIGGILNDAQVYPPARTALGDASGALAKEADALWPRPSWESSDPPGPPSAHRVDVKIESVNSYAPNGLGVALQVSVTRRGGEPLDFKLPIAAAQPLIVALTEQVAFWLGEVEG